MGDVRDIVREKYGEIAETRNPCCGPQSSCCGVSGIAESMSTALGYSAEELKSVPQEANLGLGCGNPTALASLKAGEVVLDLGAGGGMDCFLAAQKVGREGKVIGVDMTPEMISLARKNAAEGNISNVEFRLGEIENLPAADRSVDVIISNCVINLSPNKARVFQEAHRVLKPGGRFMVSDIVLTRPLPGPVKESIDAYVGCVAGALLKDEYLATIESAGFKEVAIHAETPASAMFSSTDPIVRSLKEDAGLTDEQLKSLGESVVSMLVEGKKQSMT